MRAPKVTVRSGRLKARRKGLTFCAPSCGRGCTHAEYLAAMAGALKLASTLGRGWNGEVWDNLGWHYKAVNSRAGLEVYHHHRGNYWATITDSKPYHNEHGATARSAVRRVVRAVQRQARRLEWALRTTPL